MPSKAETHKAMHEAFIRRDFASVLATLADSFTYRDHGSGMTFHGKAGFNQFMEGWVKGFSNATPHAATYIDGGDVSVAQFHGKGINDGPVGPFPASGKKMDLPFCEIMHFNSAGQAVSGECYYDMLSMMVQLGHMKAPMAASA